VTDSTDERTAASARGCAGATSERTGASVTVPSPPVRRGPDGRFAPGSGRPARRTRGGAPGNVNAVRSWALLYWRRGARPLPPGLRWVDVVARRFHEAGIEAAGGPERMSFARREALVRAASSRGAWLLAQARGEAEHEARFKREEREDLRIVFPDGTDWTPPAKTLRELLMSREASQSSATVPASSSVENASQRGAQEVP